MKTANLYSLFISYNAGTVRGRVSPAKTLENENQKAFCHIFVVQ
jgi:hypothetical protein